MYTSYDVMDIVHDLNRFIIMRLTPLVPMFKIACPIYTTSGTCYLDMGVMQTGLQ